MKKYITPNFELINMISTDVITTSGEQQTLSSGDPTGELSLDFGMFGIG